LRKEVHEFPVIFTDISELDPHEESFNGTKILKTQQSGSINGKRLDQDSLLETNLNDILITEMFTP